MKLSVYKMKNGIEKDWDNVDFANECEVVKTIEGNSNEECEKAAVEQGFGDSEIYGWTYGELC